MRALESLLDDPSPVVRQAVALEIRRIGRPALAWLEELATDHASEHAAAAEAFLEALAIPNVVAAMRRFIRGGKYDLEEGIILLQRVVRPRIEAKTMSLAFESVAIRVRELLAVPSSPSMVVRALNRVLYHEYGYRGEPDHQADPATILVGDVLALRRGIPMALGVLYLLLARRVGLAFEPIVLSDRFLLGHMRDREPFIVDPFARGRLYNWAEAQDLVPVEGLLSIQRLWPSPAGEVLRSFCERLSEVYEEREETHRAELFASFVREFDETSERRSP